MSPRCLAQNHPDRSLAICDLAAGHEGDHCSAHGHFWEQPIARCKEPHPIYHVDGVRCLLSPGHDGGHTGHHFDRDRNYNWDDAYADIRPTAGPAPASTPGGSMRIAGGSGTMPLAGGSVLIRTAPLAPAEDRYATLRDDMQRAFLECAKLVGGVHAPLMKGIEWMDLRNAFPELVRRLVPEPAPLRSTFMEMLKSDYIPYLDRRFDAPPEKDRRKRLFQRAAEEMVKPVLEGARSTDPVWAAAVDDKLRSHHGIAFLPSLPPKHPRRPVASVGLDDPTGDDIAADASSADTYWGSCAR